MSEYIIEIPDEYFASYDTERDVYYPDERDSAMRITPIVRCRDCIHFDTYGNTFGWCAFHDIDCSERRYCAWGERE